MTDIEPRLKALMVRGLDGDGAAYGQLLAALTGYLRGYFRRRLDAGSPHLEDLVQETLLALHVKRETYDRALPLTPWVYALARYKLLDHFRRTGRRRDVPLEDAGELLALDNPEEGAVRRDIDTLLAHLPERQRRLVEDVKLSGLSMEEAGARHAMTATAVKVSVHRALKSLMGRVAREDR